MFKIRQCTNQEVVDVNREVFWVVFSTGCLNRKCDYAARQNATTLSLHSSWHPLVLEINALAIIVEDGNQDASLLLTALPIVFYVNRGQPLAHMWRSRLGRSAR